MNVSGDFGCRECDRIVSSLELGPKVIWRLLSSYCGLQVIADDDDVLIERSEYDDDDVLFEISEYDDDDAIRKIKVLKMMLLIERSKCWRWCCWSKGQSAEDVADQSGQSIDNAKD